MIDLWVSGVSHGDWDFCVLNWDALQYLKCAYIALTQNPYRIIYFPIRNIEHICRDRYTQVSPDLVLYTHQARLNRKQWNKIKKCLQFIKSKQCVIRYDMAELYKEHEKMMRQWAKSRSFYRYKGWRYRDEEKSFYQHNTAFLETSRRQALTGVIDIGDALKRDLETELEESQYLNYTTGSLHPGISFEFGTADFLRRREEENWMWKRNEGANDGK